MMRQDDVKVLIGNVLDAFGNIDPARIIVKEKLQVLIHVVDDIRRFGPPPRYSSETFECFNGVFRLSSVHSNHQAPSRDIALKMSWIDCVRHIATGGYWEDADGNLVRAGDEVLAIFRESPLLQHHFGCTAQIPSAQPGHVTLPPQKKRSPAALNETHAATASVVTPLFRREDGLYERGVSVTAQSGDQCREESWVVALKDSTKASELCC